MRVKSSVIAVEEVDGGGDISSEDNSCDCRAQSAGSPSKDRAMKLERNRSTYPVLWTLLTIPWDLYHSLISESKSNFIAIAILD